jgi:hypothetical protein
MGLEGFGEPELTAGELGPFSFPSSFPVRAHDVLSSMLQVED